MQSKNLGICNQCKSRVPAEFSIRDGQVWIGKECPACGHTESLVSTDAAVWRDKGRLQEYMPTAPARCSMQCDTCQNDHKPNVVFVDITNRCNMNCPICVATIRDMGFDFNPPLEYFEKLFAELGRLRPRPVIHLFGGEPTVRQDLLEIFAIAKQNGLKPHVLTNGLKLADEDYCRELCKAGVPVRFAFDGRNPEFYARLRGSRSACDKKLKGLENLRKYSHRKHSLIACAAWGFNDDCIADLLQFCHDNRDLISDIVMIPLTENWEPGELQISRHTTMEDVEKMVQQSIPGGQVEFMPAGLSYSLLKARSFFEGDAPSDVLLFAGVHPNCESMTLLVSDGKTYRSINHYLKRPMSELAVECAEISRKLEPQLDRLDPAKFLQRLRGQLLLIRTLGWWGLRSIRIGRLKPIRSLGRAIAWQVYRKLAVLARRKTRRPRNLVRLAVVPVEEQHSIDAARLQSCKSVFAYEDVEDGRIKYFPACSWYPFRNPLLEKISRKYGVIDRADRPAPAPVPVPAVPGGHVEAVPSNP